MTPTLAGRWQTRLATFATLGVLVSLLFVPFLGATPFIVLFWVALLGLVWDVVWILVQRLRWDRDWPPAFQWASAYIEAAFLFLVVGVFGLPGLERGSLPLFGFLVHYSVVFLAIFAWVQGPMRALFPFWRFHGGRIVPDVASGQRR